jgi:sialate O-acetylesterase
MKSVWKVFFWSVLCIGMTVFNADAALRLPNIFNDNMVLQQEQPIPVWGWATPREKVTVSFAGQSHTVTANQQGQWQAILTPVPWSAQPRSLWVRTKTDTIEFDNVLIGEVWLCSGQSNMDMSVGKVKEYPWRLGVLNFEEEIAGARYPHIRLFTVERKSDITTPQTNCQGVWKECGPETVGEFSAVAYFYGRALHQHLGIPIGLIQSAYGGTRVEAWTSREKLQASPHGRSALQEWKQKAERWKEGVPQQRYQQKLAEWQDTAEQAKQAGNPIPAKPVLGSDPRTDRNYSTSLFNAMIHPLIPYALRGAIWYQGESNAHRAEDYKVLFPALIRDWRERWGMGDFPFYYVQLAGYDRKPPQNPIDWPPLRQAQLETLALPHTGMAVAIDIGDADDIHPRNKQDVGKRLAWLALNKTYAQPVVCSGPVVTSANLEDGKVRLTFDEIHGGLLFKNELYSSFSIAGPDLQFVSALARLENDTILVWSDEIANPAAVRYLWENYPTRLLLYNHAGLPASPFHINVTQP